MCVPVLRGKQWVPSEASGTEEITRKSSWHLVLQPPKLRISTPTVKLPHIAQSSQWIEKKKKQYRKAFYFSIFLLFWIYLRQRHLWHHCTHAHSFLHTQSPEDFSVLCRHHIGAAQWAGHKGSPSHRQTPEMKNLQCVTESQNGLDWKGPLNTTQYNPLPWDTHSNRSGCPNWTVSPPVHTPDGHHLLLVCHLDIEPLTVINSLSIYQSIHQINVFPIQRQPCCLCLSNSLSSASFNVSSRRIHFMILSKDLMLEQ